MICFSNFEPKTFNTIINFKLLIYPHKYYSNVLANIFIYIQKIPYPIILYPQYIDKGQNDPLFSFLAASSSYIVYYTSFEDPWLRHCTYHLYFYYLYHALAETQPHSVTSLLLLMYSSTVCFFVASEASTSTAAAVIDANPGFSLRSARASGIVSTADPVYNIVEYSSYMRR